MPRSTTRGEMASHGGPLCWDDGGIRRMPTTEGGGQETVTDVPESWITLSII